MLAPNETFRKLNPHLFAPVAGLQNPKREHNKRGESQNPKLDESSKSVGYRVGIISVRTRLVDQHDNLPQGCKQLVDAITATLGFASDSDPRLQFEYGQVLGTKTGTIVKIEALSL